MTLAPPPIEALYDSWTWNQDAGTWIIECYLDKPFNSSSELNLWYAESMVQTLKSFAHLARAWKVSFGTSYEYQDEVKGILLEWQIEEPYDQFVAKVLQTIREFPAPIYDLSIDVDEFVYVRTNKSPMQPIQSWIRRPYSEFTISGKIKDINLGLYFSICHTLYGPADKDYSPLTGPYPEPDEDFKFDLDNNELQLLNQPLLEKALRNWEEYFGCDIEVEGIPGIQKYGFLVEPY